MCKESILDGPVRGWPPAQRNEGLPVALQKSLGRLAAFAAIARQPRSSIAQRGQARKRFPAQGCHLPLTDLPQRAPSILGPMQKRVKAKKPRARMDIRDVARRAGVSISTVSRVTNGKGTVNREMADRVWRAVREFNYQPDPQARALVSGRSHIIGLMVTEITNPFFPELIQRFEQLAVESGYEVLLASTPNDAASIAMSVRRILQRKVDGAAGR